MSRRSTEINKKHLINDIIIKPRTPNWEKQVLAKKEAEEYISICHDGVRRPSINKIKKN